MCAEQRIVFDKLNDAVIIKITIVACLILTGVRILFVVYFLFIFFQMVNCIFH